MQISINIEIFLFIIIFIMTRQIEIYATFIIFTLIHELTHAATGLALGLKIKKIEIMPFGFKITFKENKKKMPTQSLIIAIAGPLINLIIMAIAIIFKLNQNIIYANLIIAVFNLIPIYPLDGGRVLKSILSIKVGKQKTYSIINKVSNITIIILTVMSSILILYIKNIAILVALGFLWYIVIRENKRYKLVKRVYDIIEDEKIIYNSE